MKPKPLRLRRLALTMIFIFLGSFPLLVASPARKGPVNLMQPDGSIVQALLSGDEHGHLTTTLDGCALVKDADGWWCYANYDHYGNQLNSGEHVGDPDTPGYIISASRDIPYDRLFQRRKARLHRLARVQDRQRVRTRSFLSDGIGGVRHGLIILAQFQDLPFTYTRDDFERLINGPEATTALSYFKDQWKDGYTFRFDITDIVTLPQDFAWYGANDKDGQDENAAQLIMDACNAVDADIDFSEYDNDGDGEVDNVFVFYAGPNESEGAGDDYVWPHMWYVQTGAGISFRCDGVLIDNYACTSELRLDENLSTYTTLATIGTFCHEYTHTFGIMDLYDTDEEGSGGYSEAIWSYIDLMDAGNYNDDGRTPPNYSAVERWSFGMSEGQPLTLGVHTLRPVQENGDFFYLETDHEDEIYLIECRQKKGWDAYIGGSGLLVYHIDLSHRRAGVSSSTGGMVTAWDRWDLNEVNARPDHQCVDLMEPDTDSRERFQTAIRSQNFPAIYTLASHAFWPYGDNCTFTSDTEPALRFWSGADASLGLTDIRRNDDGSVTFTVFNNSEEKAPAVKIDNQIVFQDATIIQWSSVDPSFAGNSILRFGNADASNLDEISVPPYETGKYAYVIEGLKPSTAYKVQLLCRRGNIPGPVNGNASFTTKSDKKNGSYPYIYLKDVERGSNGSFTSGAPLSLRVYNAPDADDIRWYFDGKAITVGADGYYHLTRSGLLKAVVTFPGSTEIITKQVIVK